MAGRGARGGAGRCAGRAAGSGSRGTGNHNAVAASRHPPRTRTILNYVSEHTTDAFAILLYCEIPIGFTLISAEALLGRLDYISRMVDIVFWYICIYIPMDVNDHLSFYSCIHWCVGLWVIGNANVEDSAYSVRRLAARRARAKTWNWLPGGYF